MKSNSCLFSGIFVPFLPTRSCFSQKVSCAFSRRAQKRHKLGHNEINEIGDRAQKRHRKGTQKCRVFSLRRVAVPFLCLFGWEYILPPKAQKHPRCRTGQIVVSERRKNDLATSLQSCSTRFFGTAQKFSPARPDFLEPAKKIFGARS